MHIGHFGWLSCILVAIECFTTTFLRTHSWLSWVDEDDDEDEVGLKEKPEDTRYIKKDYIEIRPEAPGVRVKEIDRNFAVSGTADSEKYRCVKSERPSGV